MSAVERVKAELRKLGYRPEIVSFSNFAAKTVVIKYLVTVGQYKGQRLSIGFSFQEEGYPEYPPHFIHVKNLQEPRLPQHSRHDHDGDSWAVFSVPPNDFWDDLASADKNMKTYINRHLVRFWDQV